MIAAHPFSSSMWSRFIAPHPSITDIEQRRQSSLLGAVIFSLVSLFVITFIRELILLKAQLDGQWSVLYVSGAAIVLLMFAEYLNRQGHYKLGARVFVGMFFILAALYSTTENLGPFFGSIVVLSSAIFLSSHETLVVIAAVLLGNLVWALLGHGVVTALFFNLYMSAMIVAYVRFRSNVERERQAELQTKNDQLLHSESALQQANLTLEEKVKARTQELEVAKEEAERANTVKSAFLASMSHELRTPLNAIINFTSFVAEGDMGEVNEQQVDFLSQVLDSGKHLLALINDVLDMSKIEAGTLNLFVEKDVDLVGILTSVRNTGLSLLDGKPVALTLQADPDLPTICADRQRIFQILLNIVSNACKFTENGEICMVAHHTDDRIVLSVKDSGPGIAPEDSDKVFEAFKQTETGLRKGGGTGLGMPISRSLAEAHGGRLWLESQPGHGATFFVELPVQQLTPTLLRS
jgi:signal transduction histidine kinase